MQEFCLMVAMPHSPPFCQLLLMLFSGLVLGQEEIVPSESTPYLPFWFSSNQTDGDKWSLFCKATVNAKGKVRFAQGDDNTVGTIVTRTAFQPTVVDFEFKVRVTANPNVTRGDGYAIYLVRNSSLAPTVCCPSCAEGKFGLANPPTHGLGIRVYGYYEMLTVDMFPTSADPAFVWPYINKPNPSPYSLGACIPFKDKYFNDITMGVRLINERLTVEMTSVMADGTTIRQWKCVDGVPGLLEGVIKHGDAVLAITGGNGASSSFNDPVLQSVEFYALTPYDQLTENSKFEYISSTDLDKWSLSCSATLTNENDGVRLANGTAWVAGTMATKATLEPANVDFQFEVRLTANATVSIADGFAIYIVRNSSVSTSSCCFACSEAHLGVEKPPGTALGIRAYGRYEILSVDMFPTENWYALRLQEPNGTLFSWPFMRAANIAPYSLGVCKPFSVNYFGDITVAVRFVGENITVEMISKLNSSYTLRWKCADNVPAQGLAGMIRRGDAVLAVSGGTGGAAGFNDPIVRSVRFFKVTARTIHITSTNGTTASKEATSSGSTHSFVKTNDPTSAKTLQATPSSQVATITSSTNGAQPYKEDASTFLDMNNFAADLGNQARFKTANFPESFPPANYSSRLSAEQLVERCPDVAPNLRALPSSYTGTPTYIRLAFNVDRFVEVADVEQSISVTGSFTSRWVLLTCRNDDLFPDGFADIDRVMVAKIDNVWHPLLEFRNSAEDIVMKTGNFDDVMEMFLQSLAKSTPTASRTRDIYFFWKRRGIFKAACKLDLLRFPFDRQHCGFSFMLVENVNLVVLLNVSMTLIAEMDDPMSQWKITSYSPVTELIKLETDGSQFSQVTFSLNLQRRPQYFMMNLLAPSLVLAGLELAAFLIPPGNTDRACFSVYLVLAFAVSQSQVLAKIPKTSQTVLLNVYIQSLTYFSVACTVYAIVILWFVSFQVNRAKKTLRLGCMKLRVARILDLTVFAIAFGGLITINMVMLKKCDLF